LRPIQVSASQIRANTDEALTMSRHSWPQSRQQTTAATTKTLKPTSRTRPIQPKTMALFSSRPLPTQRPHRHYEATKSSRHTTKTS